MPLGRRPQGWHRHRYRYEQGCDRLRVLMVAPVVPVPPANSSMSIGRGLPLLPATQAQPPPPTTGFRQTLCAHLDFPSVAGTRGCQLVAVDGRKDPAARSADGERHRPVAAAVVAAAARPSHRRSTD
jgi:hypothetical protein